MNIEEQKLFVFVHKTSCNINSVDYDYSLTKTRNRECVLSRQMTMAAYKHYSKYSLAKIGGLLTKNHATCLHAIKTIKNLSDTDTDIRNKYHLLLKHAYSIFKKHFKEININNPGAELKEALKGDNLLHIKINIRSVIEKYKL